MLVGVGLLLAPEVFHSSRFLHDFLIAIGTALLIAAILGVSVDYWLKKELVRDTFPALFGWMLTDELKAELGWIYGQELQLDRPHVTLTLTPTDDPELLIARFETQADIRNVTSGKAKYQPLHAVDEWFHEGRPSRVLSLRCTQRGAVRDDAESFSDVYAIGKRLPELSLDPDERVTVTSVAEETRHVSDAWFLNAIRPTVSPRVTVNAPDWIGYAVMFGSREQGRVQEITPGTHELPGTLLPGQVVQVRWWRADAKSDGEGQGHCRSAMSRHAKPG